jgi:hypothetical protein
MKEPSPGRSAHQNSDPVSAKKKPLSEVTFSSSQIDTAKPIFSEADTEKDLLSDSTTLATMFVALIPTAVPQDSPVETPEEAEAVTPSTLSALPEATL